MNNENSNDLNSSDEILTGQKENTDEINNLNVSSNSSFENQNVVSQNTVSNSQEFIKCPKCGYKNNLIDQNCKNCEYHLHDNNIIVETNNQIIDENNLVNVNKKKNNILFIIFSLVYTLVPSLLIIVISRFDNDLSSPGSFISAIISILVLLFGIEPLTCLTVKKIVKNTEGMKKNLFILDFILIVLISVLYLLVALSSYYIALIIIALIIIVIRLIVWFITRKLFVKDKIELNKKIILGLIIYIVLLFAIPNLLSPTKLNKALFKTFGSTDFSSKDVQIELIDDYNIYGESSKNFTYFHKLTSQELKELNHIYIKTGFTTNDLKKLSNLEELIIDEKVTFDEDIDFSASKKLKKLSIYSTQAKNVKLPNNIISFSCYSTLEELDISKLTNLDELNITVKTLKVNSLDQTKKLEYSEIYFNTLVFDDKQLGFRSGFIGLDFDYFGNAEITIPEYTKVSDFITTNLKVKVVGFREEEQKNENEEIKENDKISIYDNSDDLLLKLKAEVRSDY